MVGKRYFCDYCDRCFQDNIHNRKKHLNGILHQRAKKAWFDCFKDDEDILKEEQNKKPCRRFFEHGFCHFGPNCKFSHMSLEEANYRMRRLNEKKRRKEEMQYRKVLSGRIEDWLNKWEKKRKNQKEKGNTKTKKKIVEEEPQWEVPEILFSIPGLPPSLFPPPPSGWKVTRNSEWGY